MACILQLRRRAAAPARARASVSRAIASRCARETDRRRPARDGMRAEGDVAAEESAESVPEQRLGGKARRRPMWAGRHYDRRWHARAATLRAASRLRKCGADLALQITLCE